MMRPFTGWHMTAIFVIFFSVVVAVNLIMARYAVDTFGGTVVDNSYVASQNYNRWLADADQQARLGWTPKITLDSVRRIQLSVSNAEGRLENLTGTGIAIHPLGRKPAIPLKFVSSSNGLLMADQKLPAGRWRVKLLVSRGADTLKIDQPIT